MINDDMATLKLKTISSSPVKLLNSAARLSSFKCSSGKILNTPIGLTSTSRGVIPHLTPDHVRYLYENQCLDGISFPAEDFLDKLPDVGSVPFYNYAETKKQGKKILDLLVMPSGVPTFVTSRRSLPVPSPRPNSKNSISIMTSEGFRYLPLDIYYGFSARFGSDLVISPADIPNLSPGGTPGGNRTRNMIKRSEEWLTGLIDSKEKLDQTFDIIASTLPALNVEDQKQYLDSLLDKKDKLKGIAFHDGKQVGRLSGKMLKNQEESADESSVSRDDSYDYLSDLIQYINDESLLRVFAPSTESPQQILELVSKGMDVMYTDYVNTFTNAGIALDFEFPIDESDSAFSYNLWDKSYDRSMIPLGKRHQTLYGNKYKRAYVHHLLQAHEMTAWVVLQLHNIEVNARFFQGIRKCIANETFEGEKEKFLTKYGNSRTTSSTIEPTKSNQPKTRGYMISYEKEQIIKKQGISSRLNDPAYRQL